MAVQQIFALSPMLPIRLTRGNIPAARMSFESAASQGSAEAMYSLACIVERQVCNLPQRLSS